MSDRSSHATQASESDFHDSHPIDDKEKEPSIGDLTSIETAIDTPETQSHSVGDISTIDEESKSDVLGDISLLDEAFAEMEEGTAQNDSDIPVLSEAIETPTESRIVPVDADSATVPTLDQEATVYAEMLKPASSTSQAEEKSQISDIDSEPTDEAEQSLFDSPDAQDNPNIEALNSSLETAAELISDTTATTEASEISEEDSNLKELEITRFEASEQSTADMTSLDEDVLSEPPENNDDSALEALLEDDLSTPVFDDSDVESDISHLELDIASELETDATSASIDEKIAVASGNSEIEINEIPVSALSEPSEFPSSFAENLATEQETTITTIPGTETAMSDMASEISEFNPDVDLNSSSMTETSHSVGIGDQNQGQNHFKLNIPFELHSQLSQKIDELVIEATSSITDELHAQLTSRLDNLLGHAVETVLPKLVNQMATELRSEVNSRVKQQLPNIINEVLNKTRLQK